MKNFILIILLAFIANYCFSQNQPDTTYEYYFLSELTNDSMLYYENIYHYDSDGKIQYIENLNNVPYWCTGTYTVYLGNYITYYQYNDSNQIKTIFMLDKNNDTLFKQSFIVINNDLIYIYQINDNGKLVNYYRYYFYNSKNRTSTSLLNEAFNQLNGYRTYSYYHSDSIYIQMYNPCSSEYYLFSKIYFNYLSNNLIKRCIQDFNDCSYILDLSYDSDLNCTGIECTKTILDSCSERCWDLWESLNENKNLSEVSITPYLSPCFPYFLNCGMKENYYYDEMEQLISTKVFDKDTLDNWNIYISKYYKYNSTSINIIQDLGITIYPNPASEQISITNKNIKIKEVFICDIMGKQINGFLVNDNQTMLDVSNLSAGMYVAKINTEQGIITRKVQIVR